MKKPVDISNILPGNILIWFAISLRCLPCFSLTVLFCHYTTVIRSFSLWNSHIPFSLSIKTLHYPFRFCGYLVPTPCTLGFCYGSILCSKSSHTWWLIIVMFHTFYSFVGWLGSSSSVSFCCTLMAFI